MTQVSRKGFVDKNGRKVVIVPKVPGATSGNLASLDENGNLQDSGYEAGDFVPKVPGTISGHLATFKSGGNLQDSGKKITDFAPVGHTHEISDVEGLAGELAKYAPVDICLFEDSNVQGKFIQPTDPQDLDSIDAQDINAVVECLKNIIRHVCAERPDLNANVYLRAKTYESYQEFYDKFEKDATMVHVYTTLKPSASGVLVDFHIELLERDAVWYTVVQDIHKTSDYKSITFEDATFAEFWERYDAVPEKDLHEIYDKMSFTPKRISIDFTTSPYSLGQSKSELDRLWASCQTGKCYPFMCHFDTAQGDYDLLGMAVAYGRLIGQEQVGIEIYFGTYIVEVWLEDGASEWAVEILDRTSIFNVNA